MKGRVLAAAVALVCAACALALDVRMRDGTMQARDPESPYCYNWDYVSLREMPGRTLSLVCKAMNKKFRFGMVKSGSYYWSGKHLECPDQAQDIDECELVWESGRRFLGLIACFRNEAKMEAAMKKRVRRSASGALEIKYDSIEYGSTWSLVAPVRGISNLARGACDAVGQAKKAVATAKWQSYQGDETGRWTVQLSCGEESTAISRCTFMDLLDVEPPTVELRVDCVKSFDAIRDSVEIDGSLANVLIPAIGWSDIALGSNNVTQQLLCEQKLGTRATITAWENCTNMLDEAALITCPPEAVDVVQDCEIEINNTSQCVVPLCFELGNATAVSPSSASGLLRLEAGNKVEVLTPEGSWEALGASETNSADAICTDLGFEFGGVELRPSGYRQVRWRVECAEFSGTLTDSCFFDGQRGAYEMRIRCPEDGVIHKYSRDQDQRLLVVSEAGKLSQVCVHERDSTESYSWYNLDDVDNEMYDSFGRAACSSLGLGWNPKGGDSRVEIINTDELLHTAKVECPATASSLDDCTFDFDARCVSSLAIICDEREPRVDVDPSSGLVIVAESRVGPATQGVVLGDQSFDARAARVTCRELGFAFGRVIPASLVKSNDVKLEPQMKNVRCKGTESSLLDCKYSDKRTGFGCELDNARGLGVGVSCFSPDKPQTKVARLGVDQQQLEVFMGGKFGSVCGPIGDPEAHVFCRSQGFDDGAAKPSALLDPRHVAVFPPILNHLRCKGNEDDIWSCRYDRRGLERCGFVAEVICFNAEEPLANPNSGFEQVSGNYHTHHATAAPVEVGLAHDGESLLLDTGRGLHPLYFSSGFQLQAKLASVFCRMLGRGSRGEFTLVDHPLGDSFEGRTGRINGFSYADESPFDGQYDSETSLHFDNGFGVKARLGLRCHSARFPERVARFSPNGKRVVFWADGFWGMATSKFGVSRSAKCRQERTRFGKLLTNRESNVACQMMGFRYGQRQKDIRATIKEDYGRGERVVTTQVEGLASTLLFPRMQFWDVDCKGKEASLFHCDVLRRKSDIENLDDAAQFNNPSFDDYNRYDYNSFNDVEASRNSELLTAKCFGPERALRSDKILRREWFNRLDVLNVDKMIWATVCALDRDAFDLRAATVACRQLDSGLYALGQPYWSHRNDVQGTPDMAVFSQGFRCSGEESSLLDCEHIPVTDHAACSTHEHDVSVRCLTKEAVNDAELVMMDNEQRLSIKLFGEHKMVCAGSVVAGDQYFAKVACGELGFRTGTWSAVPLATRLYHHERPKVLHVGVRFMCPSEDFSSILECVWPGSESVACNEAVRLECLNATDTSPSRPSMPPQVLVGDDDVVKVQVPSMGTFFLCPALLGHDEAQALCRSLGHDANTTAKVGHITRPSFAFEPTQYLDLGCNETDSLDTCSLGPVPLQSCPMDQAATLLCEHPSPPLELRLVKSRRVEIRDADSGKWSTLCKNYHVSSATATMMCREILADDFLLGEVVELKKGQRAGKKVPISQLNMRCTGEESSLGDCQRFWTSCDSHKDDLGIRCFEDGLGPQASGVRVRDSQLEVFSTDKKRWGSVCGGVSDTVAQIACGGQGSAEHPRRHSLVPPLWKVRGIARNTTTLGLGLLDDDETCDLVARVSCGQNFSTVRLENDQLYVRDQRQYYQRRDSDAPWRVGTALVSCRDLGALSPVMINNLRRAHERRGILYRCNGPEIRPDLCPSREFNKLHMIPFGLRCLGDSRQGARFRLDQDKRVFLVFNNDELQVPVDPHAMGIWEATQVCRQNGLAGVDFMTSSRLGSLDSKFVVRSLNCNSTQYAVDDLLLCNHHLEKRKPSAKEVLVLQCRSTSTSAPSFVVSEPPGAAWGQGCPNTSSEFVEYRGWQLSCLCHDERCVEWADEATCADREARCEWFTPPDGGARRCVASFDKVGCPRYSPVWSAPFISWHLGEIGRQQIPFARHSSVYYQDPGGYYGYSSEETLAKDEYSELYSAISEVEVVVEVDAFPSLQLVNLNATRVPFCRDLAMFAALQRSCLCGSTSCKSKRSKSSCATKGECAWVSGYCVGDPVLLNQDQRCSSYHPRSIATAPEPRQSRSAPVGPLMRVRRPALVMKNEMSPNTVGALARILSSRARWSAAVKKMPSSSRMAAWTGPKVVRGGFCCLSSSSFFTGPHSVPIRRSWTSISSCVKRAGLFAVVCALELEQNLKQNLERVIPAWGNLVGDSEERQETYLRNGRTLVTEITELNRELRAVIMDYDELSRKIHQAKSEVMQEYHDMVRVVRDSTCLEEEDALSSFHSVLEEVIRELTEDDLREGDLEETTSGRTNHDS
ncbi:Scavenger receptor cysteine-rich type 1 protein M130 (CD antigen CD163) [Cleaved into: Soluble CD163 (sCD163)] [Durusdinium trenchii]|uniref:Scavenger receptor cysteine-rich type 1 protein M130 (CD antigen CD163) [Cleaved into: Soluble CD163 (SCD163)] n=1 Tax=Durusdinium trenchii TaxID=1381693 RepID=A0ABP0P6I9_9DINO